MITCSECGAPNAEQNKFCDRCGQGLSRGAARPASVELPPLAPGTGLGRGLRIVELISQTAHENRYRAERPGLSGRIERWQLREQAGPPAASVPGEASPGADAAEAAAAAVLEVAKVTVADDLAETAAALDDPNGPRAKTAELPPLRAAPPPASGDAAAIGETIASTEPAVSATDQSGDAENSAPPTDTNGAAAAPLVLADAIGEAAEPAADATDSDAAHSGEAAPAAELDAEPAPVNPEPAGSQDNLGEVFGRVMALSMTLNHPAFQRAHEGFARDGRVYLLYPDEPLTPLARRAGGLRMSEADAIAIAIQLCQAVAFVNRRGLRVNDICPESIAVGADGRIQLTGLDYISNDNELQAEPIFNDGYSAPEIYKGKKVDKRADVFSVGAVLYACLTGERLEAESWREEAGPIRFYPPHVVAPALEQAVRRALQFEPESRWPNLDALKTELVKLAGIIRIRAGVLTDVGMVREFNEDSTMAVEYQRDSLLEPAQNFLYVVADGMGGAEAGEMASAIAVGAIRSYVESQLGDPAAGGAMRQILQDALERANTQVLDYQVGHPEARGMGSTAVAALVVPPDAAVAWVGDSRAYFCDQHGMRQVTKDHSLVQRLIEIGQISPEEARHHEHKNVITRSLGARPNGPAGAESLMLRLKRGDRILLCSDGLTAHLEDAQIEQVLRRHADPYQAARELVVGANAGGGTDNISVVVIIAA
ncbi:MAG: Stp1/IreP family PP2C-type Ser/Thr phosphatase [Candidatus Binataceae bacterium]|nr:Stp1/IreP family PP2C-type Ser/Thr phosphatase [Candidatus Binataceae bacterium]